MRDEALELVEVFVTVTKEDWITGVRCNSFDCPFAKALSRRFKRLWSAGLIYMRPLGTVDSITYDIDTPFECAQKISAFDGGVIDDYTPFTFMLRVPKILVPKEEV